MIKQLFIPIAVFAVTATTAAAFQNADWSELDINLSDTEIAALEKAQDIRQAAQDEAQSVLEAAGIDESRMKEIHDAEHSARNAERESMHAALEANDYTAFQAAIANSPLAEQITSEVDFKKFVEAHNLREAGDDAGADALMAELGIEHPMGGGHQGFGGPGRGGDRQSADSE